MSQLTAIFNLVIACIMMACSLYTDFDWPVTAAIFWILVAIYFKIDND